MNNEQKIQPNIKSLNRTDVQDVCQWWYTKVQEGTRAFSFVTFALFF